MAYIGMRSPVAALINSHTDGSPITYDTGFVIGTAVAANLTMQMNDNPDYGDDVIQDNDTGINGYSGTVDVNALAAGVREKLLGWSKTGTVYSATDEAAPYVGFGFIQVMMYQGTKSYEAWWFHKAQFSQQGLSASTKQRQIEWNHPQLNVTGMGVYIDDSGNAKFFDWSTFATEDAAKAWLYSKANISA